MFAYTLIMCLLVSGDHRPCEDLQTGYKTEEACLADMWRFHQGDQPAAWFCMRRRQAGA